MERETKQIIDAKLDEAFKQAKKFKLSSSGLPKLTLPELKKK